MITCKNGSCSNEKMKSQRCCRECFESLNGCRDACEKDPIKCGDSIPDSDNEETALEVFQEQQFMVLKSIADLIQQKKDLEVKEADLKVRLQEAMEVHGIKKFTSDILNITYVAATKAESIDSTKLKAKYPLIAAECVKISNRKAYVKVEVKADGQRKGVR